MVQYAGAPVYPSDFTILDSSSPPIPSTWNVPYTALGDRTAYLLRAEAMRIACFDRQVSFASLASAPALDRVGRPGYSRKRGRWYVTSPQTSYFSESYGAEWAIQTTALQPCSYHVAFINNTAAARYGNGMFIPVTGNAIHQAYTDSTATYGGSASLPSTGWSGVVYDATLDKWVIWATSKLYTSPTSAIAWTSCALPGGTMFPIPPATNGTTTIVQGKTKGLYKTTDYVTMTELTTAFGGTAISGLCYDAWRSRFVAYLTGSSEVWTSDDSGSTWTKIAATTPFGYVHSLTQVGPMIVGVELQTTVPFDKQVLVYSADGGVTWGRAPSPVFAPADSNVYLASNGVDIIAVGLASDYKGISFSRGFGPISP